MANDLDAGASYTVADLMPAPAPAPRPPSRRPWVIAVAAVAAVAVLAGVARLAWAVRPPAHATRSLGPSKAEAARECRSAMGTEARDRADAASRSGGRSATVVLGASSCRSRSGA